MPNLDIHQYPYGSDNYGVLLRDVNTGKTAAVDAGDADALLAALQVKSWQLDELWITHHHGDHTAGLTQVKQETGCFVRGPVERSAAIYGLDEHLDDGDTFQLGDQEVVVLHTPGHTTDMINFHLPEEAVVFTGDTLFAMGCGRIFEGDAKMMWQSLRPFLALPEATQLYCGHEYTLANATFALSIDPDNSDLQARAKHVESLRENGEPTLPSRLGDEFQTNPFLRPNDPAIRRLLGMENATDAEVFAEIRRRKDNF